MWKNTRIARLLTAASWLCACSAEPPAAGSRASSPGRELGTATAGSQAPGASTPDTTSRARSEAGSSAPILQTSSAPPQVGSASNPNACDVVQLTAEPQVPDMMIVLDRSGSMERGGRWQPSVAAVRKITSQLQARIRFGLSLFPDDSSMTTSVMGANGSFSISISNGDLCTPGKIVVPVADMNATPIASKLDMTRPNGGTPTSETLMKLLDGFASVDPAPDAKQHAKFVLLVTDGAPTCPNGMGNGDQPNQPDVDLTNKAVEALAGHMVKTYVVGYDTATPGNEALAQALDGFAQRGGTGDQKHRPVEDEASLTAALESITASIASCSFKLNKAPERPEYVLVELDGKQLNLNDANGWRLVDDHTVEIVGSACTTFKSGAHLLNAAVQCKVVLPS